MNALLTPAREVLQTPTVEVPPSKSAAHRLLIPAALANGESLIRCRGTSDDIERTAECLAQMGAQICRLPDGVTFSVQPLQKPQGVCTLQVGESGSTRRFLLPVLGALGLSARIHMEGRLPQRPLEPLAGELMRHGMTLSRPSPDVLSVSGQLKAGHYVLDGSVSSQFISGLLFALPLLEGESRLEITGRVESRPYIQMTLEALASFGVRPVAEGQGFRILPTPYVTRGVYEVEGDYSGAAFMLCAGALHPAGVRVRGLDPHSPQGDRQILSVLEQMGACLQWEEGALSLRPAPLRGIELDVSHIPDLVPALAVVAATAQGETLFYNAGRLRLKESDRLAACAELLRTLGIRVEENADSLRLWGGPLQSGVCDGHGDHRIVMSAALACLATRAPLTVTTAEAVSKSYPDFFLHLQRFGVDVTLQP